MFSMGNTQHKNGHLVIIDFINDPVAAYPYSPQTIKSPLELLANIRVIKQAINCFDDATTIVFFNIL